jgi:putative hydrolase of the HAD superfamily
MRRPALIFDFGNVVAHFDYKRAASTLGARLGISGEELLDRLRPLGFSELIKSYESGRMTAEAFSKGVSGLVGLAITHDEFVAAWSDIFSLNESIAPVLAALKRAGYTLVLGSNTNDLHANQFRRQFAETLSHFDRLVLSYEVGHIKPSAAFYLACAEAAGAEPGDCVFIDDLPENVEGARAAGLVGILYQRTESLIRDLTAMGVELPGETSVASH